MERYEVVAKMNALVDMATVQLKEAERLGCMYGIPFEYNLEGTVDEPVWESSDYWDSSSC